MARYRVCDVRYRVYVIVAVWMTDGMYRGDGYNVEGL